ncbi:ribonuclease Z [Hutsoniella sourekii]|uniref:ribonuclease Z n=1 Tax=Hutsoniella sourekii TaxID=87650 RepID=UPI00047FC422|nr:ribonuclease Z [Hutsoniella sourekii]
MEIQFLGTGAGVPAKSRNVSSLALKLLNEINEVWLFDCGEATQHQILKTSLKPGKISKIFITHLHGDHIFGLPGLLSSRSFQGGDNQALTIYGPPGIKDFVLSSLKFSKSKLSYQLVINELNPQGGHFDIGHGYRCDYLPLDHGILSLGYRITEPDKEGELQIDKVKHAGIPEGPMYGLLKKGETIQLEDGRIFDGRDFIGPKQAGRVLTILGDTRQHPNIDWLAENADVLVHEGTYGKGEEEMAKKHFHSTVTQAAQTAKRCQVKRLYLNHISARYLGPDAKALQVDAQNIFPASRLVYDLNEFEIPFS